MTKDKTKEAIAVMQGYVDGKRIQWRHAGCDDVWKDCSNEPSWAFSASEYRIAPEPKYRPWTMADAPLGAWIRLKEYPASNVWLITGVSQSGANTVSGNDGTTWDYLFEKCEHSTDCGKTWNLCGVLEGGAK